MTTIEVFFALAMSTTCKYAQLDQNNALMSQLLDFREGKYTMAKKVE